MPAGFAATTAFRCKDPTHGFRICRTTAMTSSAAERLDAILARHDIVMATLNAGPDAETLSRLSREFAELDRSSAPIRAYRGRGGESGRARGA